MNGGETEEANQDSTKSQAREDRIKFPDRAITKELRERDGVRLTASFLFQKNYGHPLEEVTADEFWDNVGNGGYRPPEVSGHDTRDFINALQSHEIYEIKQLAMSKGETMPPEEVVVVSQYLTNYVISHTPGPIRWKVVLSREDGGEGGLVFRDGDRFEEIR